MSKVKTAAAANGDKKRPAPDAPTDSPTKKKIKPDSEKSPLMRLHELFPGIQFTIDQELGPSHCPTFVMSFEVFGRRFTGTGSSKKQAKINAAQSYLASSEKLDTIKKESSTTSPQPIPQVKKVEAHILKRMNKNPNVNPLMLLNEIHRGVEFEVTECLGSGHVEHRYKALANLQGVKYQGYGASKQAAKGNAAARLLNELYHSNLPMGNIPQTLQEMPKIEEEFVEEMVKAITKAYSTIALGTVGALPTDTLTAVVMTEGSRVEVVAMAIGASGIAEENISLNGAVLNDSHAEVLARRSLINYLYSQLEALASRQKAIFEMINGKPALRPNIKFHLFLTSHPCGSCLTLSTGTQQPKFLKRSLCALTYKTGNGTETLPMNKGAQGKKSTKILDGKGKIFIASCTDKLTRWQCIGLQGALLAHIIPPVYYDTVVFGKQIITEQVYYILCGRIEQGYKAEHPYIHKLPLLGQANLKISPATGGKVNADTCMAWYKGLDHPELIIGTTGKLMNNNQSCLSKFHLFKRFKNLLVMLKMDTSPYTFYCSSKMANHVYQKMKNDVAITLSKTSLGFWGRKPVEQEQFTLEF